MNQEERIAGEAIRKRLHSRSEKKNKILIISPFVKEGLFVQEKLRIYFDSV